MKNIKVTMLACFTFLLFFLFSTTRASHAGPIDLAIDSIPVWGSEIIVIAALYYAYNKNPQYESTVQRLKSSLAQNSTVKKITTWFLDLCIELDNFMLPSQIDNIIDKSNIRLAAQKVKTDIGLNETMPANGNCTPNEQRALQDIVENACGAAKACSSSDLINTINTKIGQISSCIDARKKINDRCFNGGDRGHKQQIQERLNSIKNCQKFLSNIRQ